ncbi:uncharacterized protein BT62DRAFT_1041661 [Guyanagaster necrorhizus]|uniref:Uncharacterized protein n=1 Tax=Guyanagaster necrorhizus TaxID=856835 RepID=A0A9P7VL60_9AGAR|nr:uncharacterized protein BT62DRAFT_1041661 [Guyanagaster necrorhizus MCA 3950]KAG7441929.1 hypothetical protein BT62DRAFT_1041661 [Guyanagaster necrorhizus MCA 3950]
MKDFHETDIWYPIEMYGCSSTLSVPLMAATFAKQTTALSSIRLSKTLSASSKLGPEPVVRWSDLPRCLKCSQLCRPRVVWFGERLHGIHEIIRHL